MQHSGWDRFLIVRVQYLRQMHIISGVLFRWRLGVVVSGIGLINEVNRHWARLVLGWVTVCGRVIHFGM